MRVYLDNNVLVSLEEQEYSIEKVNALLPNKENAFIYSAAHLFELQNYKGGKNYSIEELHKKRFNSIKSIFSGNYIYYDLSKKEIKFLYEEPENVYETINQVPLANSAIKIFSNLFTKGQKAKFREDVGIDMKRINNYSPDEVIEHLNTKLTLYGTKQSFIEIMEYSTNLFPDTREFGLHNKIAGIFELLDMLGYWKDEQTTTSNEARLWDSLHTYYSTYCDYFFSDDKRTRYKAKVVFDLFKIKTEVKSIK